MFGVYFNAFAVVLNFIALCISLNAGSNMWIVNLACIAISAYFTKICWDIRPRQ